MSSIWPRSSTSARTPSTKRWTHGRICSTRRGVKACCTNPRRRVWSGGSIIRKGTSSSSIPACGGTSGCCALKARYMSDLRWSVPVRGSRRMAEQSSHRLSTSMPSGLWWTGSSSRSRSYTGYGSTRKSGSKGLKTSGGTAVSAMVASVERSHRRPREHAGYASRPEMDQAVDTPDHAGLSDLPDLGGDHELATSTIRQFRRDGHTVLRGLASSEEIAAYGPHIQRVALANSRETRPLDERDTYSKAFLQIVNLWRKDEAVARFVLARRFGRVA